MFNRRFLAASAASAALAAAGVLGTAMSANAAAVPMTVGPMQSDPQQVQHGPVPAQPGSGAENWNPACAILGTVLPAACQQ